MVSGLAPFERVERLIRHLLIHSSQELGRTIAFRGSVAYRTMCILHDLMCSSLAVSWSLHSRGAGARLPRMICRRAPEPGNLFWACGSVLILEYDWSLATLRSDGIPAGENGPVTVMMDAPLEERASVLPDAKA